MAWKINANNGQMLAGGNRRRYENYQLNWPINIIVDKINDSLIICDQNNRRIVRWPKSDHEKGNMNS
jgi:hypothetical protein